MTTATLIKIEPEWREIHRIADSLAPDLQATILRALETLRKQIPLGTLTELLADGDLAGALGAANIVVPDLTPKVQGVLADAIRQVGNRTAEQLTGVLGEGLDLGVAGVAFSFNLVDPRVVRWAERNAATLITEVTKETKQAIRGIVSRGILEGTPPRQQALKIRQIVGLHSRDAGAVARFFDGLVEDGVGEQAANRQAETYARRLLRRRAENIARTETIRASNMGQQLAWEQASEQGWLNPQTIRRVWIATDDDRTCPRCMSLDDTTVELNEQFREGDISAPKSGAVTTLTPPLHPSCVPGDTLVAPGGRITGVSERQYDGDMVIIRTATGQELSCTPNHPVLTPHGWVPAGQIVEGDYVVRAFSMEGIAILDGEHNDMPASIEQIADTLFGSGEMPAVPVPVSPEDFHGDGVGSKVAIVGSDRFLVGDEEPSFGESFADQEFVLAGAGQSGLLNRPRFPDEFVRVGRPTTGSSVGSGGLSDTLVRGHLRPFEQFGVPSAAYLDVAFFEPSSDDTAVDVELFGELLDRFPGQVASDKVVHVERYPFHGVVFNLETTSGWFTTGSIITHNCRCAMGIVEIEALREREQRKR